MERVMVADITAYMSQNGFITKQQHGFLRGKSTETNLLETLSDWTIAIDNKTITTQTVVYVDFSKAFDRYGLALKTADKTTWIRY